MWLVRRVVPRIREREQRLLILEDMWKDLRSCKAFIVDKDETPKRERIELRHPHTALKRNPDRSFSMKCRVISDLRRVNLWLNKKVAFPAFAPSIAHIFDRILALKTRYPGIDVLLTKRDISGAFKRLPLHPDCARVFVRAFRATDHERRFSRSVGFFALPFGFLASPEYSALTTAPLQTNRRSFRLEETIRNDREAYVAFLYIDGGISVESNIRGRPAQRVQILESIARAILGYDCINEEKNEVEGACSEEAIILGFVGNTETCEIRVPDVKIQGGPSLSLRVSLEKG